MGRCSNQLSHPARASPMFYYEFYSLFLFFKRFYLFIFRERGREWKKRGRERSMLRETLIGCLSHAPQPGTWPATHACALMGNRTGNPLVCRLALSLLSHASQGPLWPFNVYRIYNDVFSLILDIGHLYLCPLSFFPLMNLTRHLSITLIFLKNTTFGFMIFSIIFVFYDLWSLLLSFFSYLYYFIFCVLYFVLIFLLFLVSEGGS